MNEQLEEFVNQRLPLPGLLAWGAVLPDGSLHSNGYHDGFFPGQIQQFFERINALSRKLSPCGTEGVRFCWSFQLVRVHTVSSPAGASLMLCVRNEQRPSSDAMFKVLTDFEKTQWVQPDATAVG